MQIDEFRQFDIIHRAEKLRMNYLSVPDSLASGEQIQIVETLIGIVLPISYKDFLREYGGGEFGLSNIFSADPNSEWYLPNKVSETGSYLPKDLLPISDDYCGGIYVLPVKNGIAEDCVLYWHPDGGTVSTEYETILDYIAHEAYRSA